MAAAGIISSTKKLDPDVKAFCDYIGLNDSTVYFTSTAQEKTGRQIRLAINKHILNLKGKGVNNTTVDFYSGYVALYLMISVSADTCKINFKSPGDTDADFRLTFEGSWTFSGTGALPSSVNGRANTHIVPATHLVQNNAGGGAYNRTDGSDMGPLFSAVDVGYANGFYLWPDFINTNRINSVRVNDSSSTNVTLIEAPLGWNETSRSDSANRKLHVNGVQLISNNTASTGRSSNPIYLNYDQAGNNYGIWEQAGAAFGTSNEPNKLLHAQLWELFNDDLNRGVK